MASITKLPSGSWRAQVRRKGHSVSETFLHREDARAWATEAEGQADRGKIPTGRRARDAKKLSDLISLHIDDMKDVGRPLGRSKSATLEMLHRELGTLKLTELNRERLIRFGRDRARAGAGPVTLGQDIGAIKLVISHAAAVHGVEVSVEPVNLARIACPPSAPIARNRGCDLRRNWASS